jgi:hypothetical protein
VVGPRGSSPEPADSKIAARTPLARIATSDLPSMLHGLHPLHHADRPSMTDPLTASTQWMINDTPPPDRRVHIHRSSSASPQGLGDHSGRADRVPTTRPTRPCPAHRIRLRAAYRNASDSTSRAVKTSQRTPQDPRQAERWRRTPLGRRCHTPQRAPPRRASVPQDSHWPRASSTQATLGDRRRRGGIHRRVRRRWGAAARCDADRWR